MSSPRRIMAIYDAHAGWDRRHERGQWVTRPTHFMPAWRAVTRFAAEFGPKVVIWGGDQLNAGPISHWHHGRPVLDEGLRLKDEMELLDEHLLTPLENASDGDDAEWHFLYGNHCQWLIDHIAANPGLTGMIEPENYLSLNERGYHIYSQGEIASVGKLHFVHGDVVFKNGTGQNPAQKLVNEYRRNIRCGHIHSWSSATLKTAIDAKDYHTGVVVPSLSTKNPAYNKSASNNHVHGFLFGEVWPDGSFNDYVVIINNGRFIWNGKVFDGNKK